MYEPPKMTDLPDQPWQKVSMDLCGPFPSGDYLLVVIDDYSRFPEVEIVRSTSVRAIIPHLDAIFSRQGIPEVAQSDNGPPFKAEDFKKWMKLIECHHQKTIPLWPRANGEAERFMRTIGKAIRAAVIEKGSWKQELYKFLRHYRATPHGTTGKSPGAMLYHRKIKTELPIAPTQKKRVRFEDHPPDPIEQIRRSDQRMKQSIKEMADERNHARENDLQPWTDPQEWPETETIHKGDGGMKGIMPVKWSTTRWQSVGTSAKERQTITTVQTPTIWGENTKKGLWLQENMETKKGPEMRYSLRRSATDVQHSNRHTLTTLRVRTMTRCMMILWKQEIDRMFESRNLYKGRDGQGERDVPLQISMTLSAKNLCTCI